MTIEKEWFFWGVGMVVSAGAAYGTIRAKMANFVDWESHRNVCHDKSNETNKKLERLEDIMIATREDIGFIKGKMEGDEK